MPSQPVAVLVEDDAALGAVLSDIFQREGYETVVVPDRDAALAFVDDGHADLVFLDVGATPDPSLFPDQAVIAVCDPKEAGGPFFAPWRLDGRVATIPRPYRLNDLVEAARAVVASPTP